MSQKTKILIGYSTNRDLKFQKYYKKEISKSIGCDFDIVPIFNTGTQSLTQVYNKIWQSYPYNEDYVFVFIHHDIHFKTKGWGKNILNMFNTNPDTHIIGVAGTDTLYEHGTWWLNSQGTFNTFDLWGKVWHTNGKKTWKSDFTTVNKKCDKLQPVVCVDGLFIAFDPDECEEFDDEVADSFHFYDISFCIRNKLAGKNIFVTETIQICHESGGALNQSWENNRQKFIAKYPNIHTIKNT